MTDILTRLAALTAKNNEGLLPCYCGHEAVLQDVEDYSVYSVICSREKHHETQWYETPEEAIHEWNTRPREAALIALVQEAVGEIERLRNTLHEGLNLSVRARKLDESITAQKCRELGSYHPDHVNCGTPHLWVLDQYDSDLAAWETTARKTLNPQEPTS